MDEDAVAPIGEGVHGAALCFIDPHVRAVNQNYIRSRFSEDITFCRIFWVPVVNLEPLPVDLSKAAPLDPGVP
ncbi:MAG: hypothetical protein JO345_40325 [Streptosporangiaceae bacterium]|nr:hypothetical protein [Streptosporangiaceae bacterium]